MVGLCFLFFYLPVPLQAAPFDYVMKSSASRIHISLGIVSPTVIRYDASREESRIALSGGFGFEIPFRRPLALAIDADLHDLAAFEAHTRFLVLSTGFKYNFESSDHRMLIKPLTTIGIGYISDKNMPIREKSFLVLRTGLDLNLSTDSRMKWLIGGSILWFPRIWPDNPTVTLSPIFMFRFGIII
jgi:hypothetical protein